MRSKLSAMEQDIRKIAKYLERVTREGLALEEKIIEWKTASRKQVDPEEARLAKAS